MCHLSVTRPQKKPKPCLHNSFALRIFTRESGDLTFRMMIGHDMISAARDHELAEVLIWDWTVEPNLYMADRPNPPPRSERSRSQDQLPRIESTLRNVQEALNESATKKELSSLQTSLDGLENQVNAIRDRPGFWKGFWKERSWAIPTSIAILGILGSGAFWGLGVMIDRGIRPLADTLSKTNERIGRIEGRLNVQTAQDKIRNLSTLPTRDLRQHSKELKAIKTELAKTTNKTVPGFWPTSFEVISLTSRALAPLIPRSTRPALWATRPVCNSAIRS